MLSMIVPWNAAGQMTALAVFSLAALAIAHVFQKRQSSKFRSLSDAVDNMSQGLNVFDAQGRITLLNRRYLEMYKLSSDVVKPGCSLQRLIQHRKDTGVFKGDVEPY